MVGICSLMYYVHFQRVVVYFTRECQNALTEVMSTYSVPPFAVRFNKLPSSDQLVCFRRTIYLLWCQLGICVRVHQIQLLIPYLFCEHAAYPSP